MGVLEFAEDGDLALEQSAGDFALDISNPHFFNCDYRVVVYVAALVDLAEAPLPHFLA